MESFPAADEDQFAFIKTLIDKCDYYVLIIGGRYGAPTEDGLSYTEKEYHYAVSVDVPVLVMLHGDRGSIPASKSEDSQEGRGRLTAFIEKVGKNRLRKTWTTTDGLKLVVREALDHAKATKPKVGWIRGNAIASHEALEELNEVRKQNAKYREVIGQLEVELALPPIPNADDKVEIWLLPVSQGKGYGSEVGTYAKLHGTWIGAFPIFYSNLRWRSDDYNGEVVYYVEEEDSCEAIGAAFASEFASFDTRSMFRIGKNTYDRLSSYYIEIGLMVEEGEHPFTEAARRLARRYRINGGAKSGFTIVEGEVSKKNSLEDDEIPF